MAPRGCGAIWQMRQLDPVPQKNNEWMKGKSLVNQAFTKRVAGKKSVIVSRALKYKGKAKGIQLELPL